MIRVSDYNDTGRVAVACASCIERADGAPAKRVMIGAYIGILCERCFGELWAAVDAEKPKATKKAESA